MRYFLSEYGLLVVSICGCMLAVFLWNLTSTDVKEFSKNFVGNLTGTYVAYDDDITLEEIENSEF